MRAPRRIPTLLKPLAALGLVAAVSWGPTVAARVGAGTAAAEPRVRAFTGARVFDGRGRVLENASLVVRDGRIVAVGSVPLPPDAERVDLASGFVMPGLVSAHGHVGATVGMKSGPELYSRQNVLDQLALYARYGVTSVTSLGDDREAGFRVRDEQAVPSLDRARLHVAGPVVDATTPEAARAQVAAVAAMKPDWIKIRVDDALGTTNVLAELRSPERRARVRANPATARYKEALRTASLNLKTLVDAGAPIAFGTDTGPPARFQGYFEHEELRLMVEAGLTPTQALVAATSGTARCLGTGDVGRLEPGAWADFVVLREDPRSDIRRTHGLESVWIAGNRVPGRRANP